jgi:prephenate dehydrogenase
MGGSLALSLKNHCHKIYGYDLMEEAVSFAREIHAIDDGSTVLEEFIPHSDLIVLAAPVQAILALIGQLPRLHPGSPIVIDLGSTKKSIVAAMQALPERFQPIGGHPMCGKEKSSIHFAEADLFKGNVFLLSPLERTTRLAYEVSLQLVDTIGAKPLLLDPETHDRLTAATSHFPYLLANVLAQITPQEAISVLGPGFRSTARLAGSSPEMMLDILKTNRENILSLIDRYQDQLAELKKILAEENYSDLLNFLRNGSASYHQLMKEKN